MYLPKWIEAYLNKRKLKKLHPLKGQIIVIRKPNAPTFIGQMKEAYVTENGSLIINLAYTFHNYSPLRWEWYYMSWGHFRIPPRYSLSKATSQELYQYIRARRLRKIAKRFGLNYDIRLSALE